MNVTGPLSDMCFTYILSGLALFSFFSFPFFFEQKFRIMMKSYFSFYGLYFWCHIQEIVA